MNGNVVPSDVFVAAARAALAVMVDWTDLSANVRLVEGDFNPHVMSTYPSTSAAFTALDADGDWEIQYDALTQKFYLVAPDPADGWDFISDEAGVTITGFVVSGADESKEPGAQKFETPIAVTAVGQHITLPWVAFDVTQVIADAITPYAMP